MQTLQPAPILELLLPPALQSPLSGSGYLSLSVNTASAALPENPGLICSRDVSLHKFNKHYPLQTPRRELVYPSFPGTRNSELLAVISSILLWSCGTWLPRNFMFIWFTFI